MSCHHSPLASPLLPFGVVKRPYWRCQTGLMRSHPLLKGKVKSEKEASLQLIEKLY